MKGHVGKGGLQAHSIGTVYPYAVVSSGSLFYSVDYRKSLNKEMSRLPYATFNGAFKASMMRRIAEYCGPDNGTVTFSIDPARPAGKEIELYDSPAGLSWEYIGLYKPLAPELLGSAISSNVEDGRQYQLNAIGDGSFVLWGELVL